MRAVSTYDSFMFESSEILEFPLGQFISLGFGFVNQLGSADLTAVIDVGSDGETTLHQFGHEIDLRGFVGP